MVKRSNAQPANGPGDQPVPLVTPTRQWKRGTR